MKIEVNMTENQGAEVGVTILDRPVFTPLSLALYGLICVGLVGLVIYMAM